MNEEPTDNDNVHCECEVHDVHKIIMKVLEDCVESGLRQGDGNV